MHHHDYDGTGCILVCGAQDDGKDESVDTTPNAAAAPQHPYQSLHHILGACIYAYVTQNIRTLPLNCK